MAVGLVVEQVGLEEVNLALLHRAQGLPHGVLAVNTVDLLRVVISAGVALHHNQVRVGCKNGFHVDFNAVSAGSIVRVGNVDGVHLADHAAQHGARCIRGDVVLRRGEHGKDLRRVFLIFRNAAENINYFVQRGHSHGVPQFRMAVQVAEDLEPL